MIVFLIDADNLSSAAWIEEACSSLEAAEGSLAVRRAYGSAENRDYHKPCWHGPYAHL